MTSVEDIRNEVLRVLGTLTPKGAQIRTDQKLIADLKLLGDDDSAMIADLEWKYRLKIPRAEWETVITVQDVIDLLIRHVRK